MQQSLITYKTLLLSIFFVFILYNCKVGDSTSPDVIIVGGGASGISAGITSARLGVKTLIVEETEWLGGMLTSAGVSAVDGNYNLPGGIWGEFKDSLVSYYGSAEALQTGWVSRVLFEPSVGNKIFQNMASKEKNLKVSFKSRLKSIKKENKKWTIEIETPAGVQTLHPQLVIDATELGDVAKECGVKYDIGMDSHYETSEEIAPEKANEIIQDLTYVAILKDYGYDVSIPRPEGYDSTQYFCCCINPLCVSPKEENRMWQQERMITYGKLPNNKYMINWPIEGNDYYLNLIENTPEERIELLQHAKDFTLGFLYFMQKELGMVTFGLADDEFPTSDNLPLIPYHRESRRIHGMVQYTLNHISEPYTQDQKLYRTAIAVGDYPVDHHHARYHNWESLPDLHFYPVPSYGLPLGVIIPKNIDGLLVAEKSISVTNLVNGTTRLQPVVLQIGQAAGTLAALSIIQRKRINDVSVRNVQHTLLENGAYLLPYLDVPEDSHLFLPLQRIGVTGILKGIGKNEGWSNQTWFRINDLVSWSELSGLTDVYPNVDIRGVDSNVTVKDMLSLIKEIGQLENIVIDNDLPNKAKELFTEYRFTGFDINKQLTRTEAAVLIDQILQPFNKKEIDIFGSYKQ